MASEDLAIYRVDTTKWKAENSSNTFHGRDIMAPVAAHLACNRNIESVGQQISAAQCVSKPASKVIVFKDRLQGSVIHVDRFGNICTNLSRSTLNQFSTEQLAVGIGGKIIAKMAASYAAVRKGDLVALFDSHNLLEIAVNQGNAAKLLGVTAGAEVTVRKMPFD